jgi:hypothetical protein
MGSLASPLDEQLVSSIPASFPIRLRADLVVNLPLTFHVRLPDVFLHHQRTASLASPSV